MKDEVSEGSLSDLEQLSPVEAFYLRVREFLPEGYSLRDSMILDKSQTPICAPLMVSGQIVSASEDNWSYEIEFLNHFNKRIRREVAWDELTRSPRTAIAKLAGAGLKISSYQETAAFVARLHETMADRLLIRLSRPGWSEDAQAFALHTEDPVSLAANIAYRAPSGQRSAETRGTFEDWRDGIAAMARQNPNMIFAICAGLTPAILKFLPSASSMICHFFGPTSVGKTRLLRVGLSVWPRETTLEQNWHSTVNGLEGVMQARNDHLCALDELPAVPETRLSDAIYMIANGMGKERANAEGKSSERHTWRTVALSSGESTIWSSLRNSGSVVKGGLGVRAIDIPVEGRHGAFDCLHEHKDVEAFLSRLDSCLSATAGTAAPKFVRALMALGLEELNRQIPERVQRCSERLQHDLGDLSDDSGRNEINRVIRLFAMICTAGHLGVQNGILPWDAVEVDEAVLLLARRWLVLRGSRPRDEDETLQKLRGFLALNAQSFVTASEAANDPDRAKRGSGVTDDEYYYFWPRSLSLALNCQSATEHEFKRAVEHLQRADVLAAGGEKGTLQVRLSGCGQTFRDRAYRIKRDAVDLAA